MTVWTLDDLLRVIDGDSLVCDLSRMLDDDGQRQLLERRYDCRLRLVTVDTPERGETGWAQAREDTAAWLSVRPRLQVETYGPDNFGRLLADVYVQGDRSQTLSQYLMRDKGWLPYVRRVG